MGNLRNGCVLCCCFAIVRCFSPQPQIRSLRYFSVPSQTNNVFVCMSEKDASISSSRDDSNKSTRSVPFQGAGLPRPELEPEELPTLLMEALELNDFPTVDAGLESMWAFAGDTTRHIFQHNLTDFIESAHETADTLPTSFYGAAMYGKSWGMETETNRVGGEQGWIATQVMKTISSDGRLRRWQWELRKNRRPPNRNCWFVESIGSSDRKGQFEAE